MTTVRLTPDPFPDDPACPSCRKPIKHGTPVVLKFGQTLHLRCWTLMLRGQTTAMERNRLARAQSRERLFRAAGEAGNPSGLTGETATGPP